MLIPGGLYTCKVARSDPDKEYYFVYVVDPSTGEEKIQAFIHKQHVVKPLKLGEFIIATSTGRFLGKYPVLSQKIPQHIINVIRLYLDNELKEIDAFLDRVGSMRRGRYCKVGVWGKAGLMPFYELNQFLGKSEKFKLLLDHIPHPIFIPGGQVEPPSHFTEFPVKFMLNALYPAPVEKILDYEYKEHRRAFCVVLQVTDLPLFLWKDYLNVKLAAKLTKVAYHLVSSETGKEIVVDPYRIETELSLMTTKEKERIENESVDFFDLD